MAEQASSFPHPLYERYVLKPFYRDAETYYYQPMMAANRTHAVMLYRCGILSLSHAQALLSALDQIETAGAGQSGLPLRRRGPVFHD